jgi:hypothetical protein
VALDGHLSGCPLLHPVGVPLQGRARLVADRCLVQIEEDVVERLLRVHLIQRLPREDFLLAERRGSSVRVEEGAEAAVAAAAARAAGVGGGGGGNGACGGTCL